MRIFMRLCAPACVMAALIWAPGAGAAASSPVAPPAHGPLRYQLGLAIAQKNAAEISAKGARIGFDFAIAEECQAYSECGSYTRVYGARVIEIEYPDNGGRAGFEAACRARGDSISIVYRDRDVLP